MGKLWETYGFWSSCIYDFLHSSTIFKSIYDVFSVNETLIFLDRGEQMMVPGFLLLLGSIVRLP